MLTVSYFSSKHNALQVAKAASAFGYNVQVLESGNPFVPGKWVVQLGLSPVLQNLMPQLTLFQTDKGKFRILDAPKS